MIDAPASLHFSLKEFAVSASFPELVQPVPVEYWGSVRALMVFLESIRLRSGPIKILSGYRPPSLNRAVGGSATSQHRYAQAADIRSLVEKVPATFQRLVASPVTGQIETHGLGQVIWYPDQNFIHIALKSEHYPVFTPCVHWSRWRYQPIGSGKAGLDWLIDNVPAKILAGG